MCLISVGFGLSDRYSLVIAANRDERHARPSEPARWWADEPDILGGRDEVAGGSWLAIDRRGRVAAVTNFFEPPRTGAPRSRGELVVDFLRGGAGAEAFSVDLDRNADEYGPFNLLLFDGQALRYASNRSHPRGFGPGIHVLSNGAPGIQWPKVRRAEQGLAEAVAGPTPEDALFDLLAERDSNAEPPDSYRRSLFILDPVFGTRCSTVLMLDSPARTALFVERRFDAAGRTSGESRIEFELID